MGVLAKLPVRERWNIGIVKAPIAAFLEARFQPTVRWLPELPANRYRADPFALPAQPNQPLTLLFEEFDYRNGRGIVTAATWRPGGVELHEVQGFPPDVHLSYPFLFEHAGTIFCVPESWQARRVSLYRALTFPQRWELAATLIDNFPGVDSTLFVFGGRWWLACTHQDIDPFGRLWLWHAPLLEGPWRPHRGNPVKTDLRSSRPGGTPFWFDGQLYRPAQNDADGYGRSVIIHRLRRLDEECFDEVPVREINASPEWRWRDGVHTLSAAGAFTLIDAKSMGVWERAGRIGRGTPRAALRAR